MYSGTGDLSDFTATSASFTANGTGSITISANGSETVEVQGTPESALVGQSTNLGATVTANSNGDSVTPNSSFTVVTNTVSVSTGTANVGSGTLGPEATLNGNVVEYAQNSSISVAFEYREQSATTWNQTSPPVSVSSPTTNFQDTATGLLDNVTYEYRAIITSATGNINNGAIQTFSTGSSGDTTDSGGDTTLQGTNIDDPNIEPGIEPLDDEEQNSNDDEDPNDDNQNQ
jgi:hypothetical protein